MDQVKTAFWKLQISAGQPKKVRPKLGVVGGVRQECWDVVWVRGEEEISIAVGVVDKSNDRKTEFDRAIRGTESSTVGIRGMIIKENRTDNHPNHRRVGTALASTKDRKFFAMGIKIIGDIQGSFQFESGLFKSLGVDKNHMFMEAFGTSNKASKGWDDTVIATGSVIIKIQ